MRKVLQYTFYNAIGTLTQEVCSISAQNEEDLKRAEAMLDLEYKTMYFRFDKTDITDLPLCI